MVAEGGTSECTAGGVSQCLLPLLVVVAAGRCRVPANGLLIYLPDPDAVKVDAEARAELLSMGFPEAQVGGPCSAAAAAMHAGKFGVQLTHHAYRVYRAYHAYRACRARTAWTFIAPPGCAGCCSSGGRA